MRKNRKDVYLDIELFKEYLKTKNEKYRNGEFEVVSETVPGPKGKVLLKDKYGFCEVTRGKLIDRGTGTSIQSAIDKIAYSVNRFREVHGNTYDYSLFTTYGYRSSTIDIICKKHGVFKQVISDHYSGYGCYECGVETRSESRKYSIKEFIEKARSIHGNKYDYSKAVYENSRKNITIVCKEHGEFNQNPVMHLSGQGCARCGYESLAENSSGWSISSWQKAAERSKHFDSYKVYIIKCLGDNECFYKIGRTFNKLSKRFNKRMLPYNYETVGLFICETAEEAFDIENELKRGHKKYKYVPNIEFGGMYECFTQINIEGVE